MKKFPRFCENISDKKKKVMINSKTINIIGFKIIGYFGWFFWSFIIDQNDGTTNQIPIIQIKRK